MSLSAIQDNLVKTNLVQQTQARGDEVGRSQQIAQVVSQAEHDRQGDQVVLMTRQKDQNSINPDDRQREQEERRREKRGQAEEEEKGGDGETDESGRPGNTEMHRINIVV